MPISDQKSSDPECLRVHSLSTSQSHGCQVVAKVPVLLLLLLLRPNVIPEVVQIFQSPLPHQNSISSLEPRPFTGGFLRTDLHLSKPNFVSTRCSSDEASRPHQQPLIHLFVSLAARTSWSGINAHTDSPNMHKGDTHGVPSKYWNGVLPSGHTVNLERTNPAQRSANGMAREIAEKCVPVFGASP